MNQRQRKSVTKALLEELSKHGIISAACKRAGLPKATYYRWYEDDKEFQGKADEALMLGKQEANDLARSRLLQKIDQGDAWAIRFQLSRRDRDYKLPPEPSLPSGEADKDELITASYQVLSLALSQGNVATARFVLERLDKALMSSEDLAKHELAESKQLVATQMEETNELLRKIVGI